MGAENEHRNFLVKKSFITEEHQNLGNWNQEINFTQSKKKARDIKIQTHGVQIHNWGWYSIQYHKQLIKRWKYRKM